MRRPRGSRALGVSAVALWLVACPDESAPPKSGTANEGVAKKAEAPAQPASAPASRPDRSAAQRRAEASRARLEASEAGRVVLAAIEAQGGLEAWFEGGALRFRYDYQPVEGTRRNSVQVIDLMTSRAYHELQHPTTGTFAWDGDEAWKKLEDGEGFAARFWALTPYYFVAQPFVLGDPGVNLELVDDDPKKAGFSAGAQVVEATFDAGTGDAPDDYYVLYIDPKSHRLLGLRYIVTYEPFFEGKETDRTPEKLVVYDGWKKVGGVELATQHRFYAFGDGEKGDLVTRAEVSDLEHGVRFDASRLEMPDGAVISKM